VESPLGCDFSLENVATCKKNLYFTVWVIVQDGIGDSDNLFVESNGAIKRLHATLQESTSLADLHEKYST